MEPECVVCLQAYDEGEHTPRVLSCGHSLCQSCTLDLPSHWGGSTSRQTGGGLVRCPECKQHTKLPLGGHLELPRNFELMRLIQSLQTPPKPVANVMQESKPLVTKRKDTLVEGEQPHRSREGSDKDSLKACLLSRELNGEPVLWILPQSAIKRRKDTVLGFCIGDMCLDWKPSTKMQEVSLQSLLSMDSQEAGYSEGSTYKELVQSAWERVEPEVRAELLHMLTLAHRCKHIAEVPGLWMSEEGTLFLVSRVHVEGIKQARGLFFPGHNNEFSPERDTTEGESSSCDDPRVDDNTGKTSLGTLVRLGVELCEIVLELHAAGHITGVLWPGSLVLDGFSHLQLHTATTLFRRQKIRNIFSGSRSKLDPNTRGVHSQKAPGALESNKLEKLWTENYGTDYEYLSPEVVNLFRESLSRDEAVEKSSPMLSSCPASADEVKQSIVTEKADVWSLGCLLLQLFSGSALLGGLPFSEVYNAVVHEKSIQQVLVEAGLPVLGQQVHVREQVLKCFAHVPSERPQVGDIWWALKELLDDQALGSPSWWNEASAQGLLGLGVQEFTAGDSTMSVNDARIESQTDVEARIGNMRGIQTSAETRMGASSLTRALIDTERYGSEVKTLHGHRDTVSCLAVCGDYLISASFDKTLRVWVLKDNILLQVLEGHEQRITALAVNEESELCVSGDYGGQICVWNLATQGVSAQPIATWQEHQDWRYSGVASLIISNDEVLYSGSGDRTVKAWSILDSRRVAVMEGHKGVVSALLVEGQVLYSGSWDGTIRLWWRPDHSILAQLGGVSSLSLGGIRALVKSSAAGLLFTGHDSGVVQVWNDEECVGSLEAHKGVVSALACDQTWLYSGSWDGFIKAWPIEEILRSTMTPVEKKCSGTAVTALLCSHEKLYVGLLQTIQIYGHKVANQDKPRG